MMTLKQSVEREMVLEADYLGLNFIFAVISCVTLDKLLNNSYSLL